jgi:hypothetical protein
MRNAGGEPGAPARPAAEMPVPQRSRKLALDESPLPPYDKKRMIDKKNIRGAFMTEPTYEELKARLTDLEKQVETKKRSGVMEFRVSEKGGVSVYGLGRFPVTLYYEQWTRLLDAAPDLKAFIEENKSKLKMKQG